VELDGERLVLVGAWNGRFYALRWQASPPALVEAWHNELPPADGLRCPVRKVRSGATVGQIIPGGDPEIAFGYMSESDGLDQYKTARLRVVTARGGHTLGDVEVWDWKSTPSAADLDPASPGLELTGGRYQGHYALRGDGSGHFAVAWNPTIGDGNGGWGGNRTSPAVADLDGDGDLEVVMGVEGSMAPGLVVYDGATGRVEWTLELPGTTGLDSSPAIGDLDGDGELELAFFGRDGKAYAIDSSCK